MLQLMRPRCMLQLRNSISLLHHHPHVNQSSLARAVQSANHDQFHITSNIQQISDLKNDPLRTRASSFQIDTQIDSVQRFAEHTTPDKLKSSTDKQSSVDPSDNKPSRAQMEDFHKYLENNFQKYFTERPELAFFEPDLILDDNQSGVNKRQQGLHRLIQFISYSRIYFSLMYSFNKMKTLSIADLYDEGVVKLRWRITSKGRLFIFLQFWKVREMKRKEYLTDGIAYFHLNGNGKVYHILIEKIEKDKDEKLISDPIRKVLKETS